MSCGLQSGGAPTVIGQLRTLKNGAQAGYVADPTAPNGKRWRIVKGSTAGRLPAHAITQQQAQRSFDRYYKTGRMPVFRRGPRKGSAVYKSASGRAQGMSMDQAWTNKSLISDSRYLGRAGPRRHDFRGVDDGPLKRGPLSAKQAATLAKGRAGLARKLAASRRQRGGGCHPIAIKGGKSRCSSYDGDDTGDCHTLPNKTKTGRAACGSTKTARASFRVSSASEETHARMAQLRAIKAAKAVARPAARAAQPSVASLVASRGATLPQYQHSAAPAPVVRPRAPRVPRAVRPTLAQVAVSKGMSLPQAASRGMGLPQYQYAVPAQRGGYWW